MDICKMNQTYCVALVVSRSSYRYKAYTRQCVEVLLALQKQVVIISPDWMELQQELMVKFKNYAGKLSFIGIEPTTHQSTFPGKLLLYKQYFKLRGLLRQTEKRNQTQVDLVFFMPIEDWVRPNFAKWIFKKLFPYSFSGLLTKTMVYEEGSLKLNVDPKYWHPDYLLSATHCVGVCTLDRFNTENIRSRIYKKVWVLPDVSDFDSANDEFELVQTVKKMAKTRMIVGLVAFNGEFPSNFIQLILNTNDYFFVLIGQLSPEIYTEEQKEILEDLLLSNRKNFFLINFNHLEREELNRLVKEFDLAYLDIGDKELPSELITKAAKFHKPILCLQNGQSARIVDKFDLGVVVMPTLAAQMEALHIFKLQIPFSLNYSFESMRTYEKLQGQDYLTQTWEELLWF
jgi:hypothetical protein